VTPELILWGAVAGIALVLVGGGTVFLLRHISALAQLRAARAEVDRLLAEATARSREIELQAKDEALKLRASIEAEHRERRAELQRLERRLAQKEESLEQRMAALERREKQIAAKEQEVTQLHQQLEQLKEQQLRELERIAGLTSEEAKRVLLQSIENEVREEANRLARQIEREAKEEAEKRAREIIAVAIQRVAADHTAETTVSVVPLPNEEMKSRIIGREGRNIRAFEAATGVDLVIDDTPDAVIVSAFDPIRREIARLALSRLVQDGRIQPARVEEMVAKARQEVEQIVREAGERAALEAGVHGLHSDIIEAMGRLKFRMSYGQNVLAHSVEVSLLAAAMAAELGADVNVTKRAAFLHDIGKALVHEMEGPHALIGAEFLRRYNVSPKVVHAVEAHHGEVEPQTVEAFLVAAADAISAARPGARRETVENYIKRLEALEAVASSFEGVEKAYAIQAGREVRIMVKPGAIDDLQSIRLARDIVKKIEENLEHPGQIKVTVIREWRVVEYAH
jgi:ribonuclease Y